MEKVEDYPRKTITETRDLTDQVEGLPLSQVIANLTAAMTDLDPTVKLSMGGRPTDWRMTGLLKLSWERDETDQEWRDRAQRTLNNRVEKARKKASKKRAKEEREARIAAGQVADPPPEVGDVVTVIPNNRHLIPNNRQWWGDMYGIEVVPFTHDEEEDLPL